MAGEKEKTPQQTGGTTTTTTSTTTPAPGQDEATGVGPFTADAAGHVVGQAADDDEDEEEV